MRLAHYEKFWTAQLHALGRYQAARDGHAHGWGLSLEKLDAWVRRPDIQP